VEITAELANSGVIEFKNGAQTSKNGMVICL